MNSPLAIEPWEVGPPRRPLPRWLARAFVVFGVIALTLIALAILLLPNVAAAQPCISPLAPGTVVSSDQNGGTVTVQRGATLTVRYVVEAYSQHYGRSSDPGVIRPVSTCPEPPMISSLPIGSISFRAYAPGRATVYTFTALGDASLPNNAAEFRLNIDVPSFDVKPWIEIGGLVTLAGILLFRTNSIWTPPSYTSSHQTA